MSWSYNRFYGLGIRRKKKSISQTKTLDVFYPWIENISDSSHEVFDIFFSKEDQEITVLEPNQISKISSISNNNKATKQFEKLKEIFMALETNPPNTESYYSEIDIIIYRLNRHDQEVRNTEEGYLKLHLISRRLIKPHETNLAGLFGQLENLAWTNYGPMLVEDFEIEKLKKMRTPIPLTVSHVDKFPYLVNYHIPSGVRIADGSRVRLGAYLGQGSTVMPAGYVNFNAGSLGQAMIEGRISAGVLVEENSDIGGGASIMGTLSGGNQHVISVGAKCLIGANAGIGISLGFGCTVAAGTYITAGSKVSLYDQKKQPVDIDFHPVKEGENIVKAMELSGKDYLLFVTHSTNGKLMCFPNPKTIELNEALHKFN